MNLRLQSLQYRIRLGPVVVGREPLERVRDPLHQGHLCGLPMLITSRDLREAGHKYFSHHCEGTKGHGHVSNNCDRAHTESRRLSNEVLKPFIRALDSHQKASACRRVLNAGVPGEPSWLTGTWAWLRCAGR